MEGKTHRIGGTVGALAGYIVMKESGLVLSESVVNPALQFLLIYSSGIYGGMWSDNDHHWESSPLKDPASWVQNKLLHVFNKPYEALENTLTAKQKRYSFNYKLMKLLACRHRSWQTHSELTLVGLYFLWVWVTGVASASGVDKVLWWLLLTGFGLGVISHLVLDMLTTDGSRFALGIWINTFTGAKLPETIRLVPRNHFFATGSPWEMTIRKALSMVQYVLLVIVIGYLTKIDVMGIVKYVFSFLG